MVDESEKSLAFFRDLLHELKDPFAAIYGGCATSGRLLGGSDSAPATG